MASYNKKADPVARSRLFKTRTKMNLFYMTLFTLGRTILFFVAIFAQFVENGFGFGSFGAIVTATASASFYAIVMASFAIGDSFLVFGMLKGNRAHFCVDFDFSRAVIRDREHSGSSNKSKNNQQNNEFFHG